MESVVLVCDIRLPDGDQQDVLDSITRAAQTFAHEKLVHKPTHEVGVVVFGSAKPNNERLGDDGSKYENVCVWSLACAWDCQ